MPVRKVCVVCSKEFFVPPTRAKSAKACSHACAVLVRNESRKRKLTKICPHCGQAFEFPRSHGGRRVYCSDACRFASPRTAEIKSLNMTGENNPMWKGGVVDRVDGYVYEQSLGHPLAGHINYYVLQHRLVMEAWMQRVCPDHPFLVEVDGKKYLSRDILVHHINTNRKDNAPHNLLACTSGAHLKIHHGHKPEPGTYWPEPVDSIFIIHKE